MSSELAEALNDIEDTTAPQAKLSLSDYLTIHDVIRCLNSLISGKNLALEVLLPKNDYSGTSLYVYRLHEKTGILQRKSRDLLCNIRIEMQSVVHITRWGFEDYEDVRMLAENISAYFGTQVLLKASKWDLKRWGKQEHGTITNKDLLEALAELEDVAPQVALNLS